MALTDGALVVDDALESQHRSEKLMSSVCRSMSAHVLNKKVDAGS